MTTATQIRHRRRKAYPKEQPLNVLSAFAFTDQHRRHIAAGELILRNTHTTVIDITRRGNSYYLRDDRGRETCIPRSARFTMIYPAVPVPLPPRFDPTVIPPQSAYTSLTLPMRRALDYFAWSDWNPKPHPNTIRALEKRGLISDNRATPYGSPLYRATPYGCALYREYGRHDKEIQ